MLRKLLCLMALGMVLLVGGCSSSDSDPIPNVAGTWKVVANTTYNFDLILTQDGGTLAGTMIRTNGVEPDDTIAGSIDSAGAITFTRTRAGVGGWTQIYNGNVTIGTPSVMAGTFSFAGATTFATWQATKL
jgi:hypothetical protein